VVRQEGHGEDRYRFLETIRQYARDQLMASGEVLDSCRRHFVYFAKRAIEIRPNPRLGDVHQEIIRLLREEQENFEPPRSLPRAKKIWRN
jgi:predicted ATPase